MNTPYIKTVTGQKQSPEVFCKKGVFRNFAKFTGKHLRQILLFNKVASLRPVTLFKKRPWHRCFPVNFAKFLRTPFLIEHLRWLLLTRVFSVMLRFLTTQNNDHWYNFKNTYCWLQVIYAVNKRQKVDF